MIAGHDTYAEHCLPCIGRCYKGRRAGRHRPTDHYWLHMSRALEFTSWALHARKYASDWAARHYAREARRHLEHAKELRWPR